MKLQRGLEADLLPTEKTQLRPFLLRQDADADSDEENNELDDSAFRLLAENRARKKARHSLSTSNYRSTKHIHGTTNAVERLFSRAKILMSGQRKKMTPRHLELLMSLRMNCHLWNEETVQQAMLLDLEDCV